jgi:hypothetical protein
MMLSAASESGAHALRVGASVLAPAGADLTPAERRQRASLELLRLAAIEEGLLAAEDPTPEDGVCPKRLQKPSMPGLPSTWWCLTPIKKLADDIMPRTQPVLLWVSGYRPVTFFLP